MRYKYLGYTLANKPKQIVADPLKALVDLTLDDLLYLKKTLEQRIEIHTSRLKDFDNVRANLAQGKMVARFQRERMEAEYDRSQEIVAKSKLVLEKLKDLK